MIEPFGLSSALAVIVPSLFAWKKNGLSLTKRWIKPPGSVVFGCLFCIVTFWVLAAVAQLGR
jgi:hypothetical protein